jgi:hypothetical protein
MRALLLPLLLAAGAANADDLAARDTADVGAKGSGSVGVFNPLKLSVTDKVELSAHPLVFFVAPHVNAKVALLKDDVRLSGELGLAVPTFAMRLTKGYLFPTFATSKDDIAWMVVPRLGLSASGDGPSGAVWTGLADVELRVPFGVTNVGPLNSFLAPLDLLLAAPLTGFVGRVGAAWDQRLTGRLRLRGELNVFLTGAQGDLVVAGQDVGPLRQLSPWFFTAQLGLDVAVGKLSRFTVGAYFANYDQGASMVVTGSDGYAERVRVRSNNILPTLDFIWGW